MHKTFYVDVDEEITSIIDRVRAEEAAEIFLVVPKDAMLTQGVINLKLFKKEIDKIGKSVMIATSDPHVKKVIERLGIKTREMTGDIEKQSEEESMKAQNEAKEEALSKKATDEVVEKVGEEVSQTKKQMDIGSDSFFDGQATQSLSSEIDNKFKKEKSEIQMQNVKSSQPQSRPKPQPQPQSHSQRTGVAGTPNVFQGDQLKKDLYSRKNGQVEEKKLQRPKPLIGPSVGADVVQPVQHQMIGQKKVSVASGDSGRRDLFGNFQEEDHKIPTKNGFGFGKVANEKKAEKFFSNKGLLENEQKKIKKEVKSKKVSSKWKVVVPILILLVILVGGGAWVYVSYPKVEISIHPKKETLSKEIKIIAKEGATADDMSSKIIPGKYVELSVEKEMEFEATGETFESDDGKARGKVTIYNKFSSSPQPLVVTTRVLSKEGKLFRLANDVTVPGMDGEKPGIVEVAVLADQPGEDFNITASTFTIEGFKGCSKYEKFEVTSKTVMTDGGSPDSNKKLAMVTQGDLDSARKKTIDALDDTLEQEVSSQLEEGTKVIIDSVEKEILSAVSSHKAKGVTKKFTYTIKQNMKAIAFNNEDVNVLIMQELEVDMDAGYLMDAVSQVVFKKGISNLEDKTVTMYVDAQAVAWPSIDKENIIKGIVGKKEEEIRNFLSNYPEIEKVEITVTPSWLATIPVSREKVEVSEIR
ncbi:MAG: hypothetical protein U9O20_00780 [Patescibacteria group bacterium]|nr:hypothetical protein [Patescibacteria group bacterium]